MSQYPSPYLPPTVTPSYGAAPPDLLKPARRASVLMFVLGGLVTLLCLLETLGAMATPTSEYAKQMSQMPASSPQVRITPDLIKNFTVGFTLACVIGGLSFTALGVGVRRGGKISTITSIALTVVVLVGLVLFFLMALVMSAANPMLLGPACIMAIPIAILTWLGIWLIPAARALSGMSAAQQQYQAQYWQYQQNMQAYMAYNQQQRPPLGYPTQGYPQAPPPPQGQLPQTPATPPADSNTPPPSA